MALVPATIRCPSCGMAVEFHDKVPHEALDAHMAIHGLAKADIIEMTRKAVDALPKRDDRPHAHCAGVTGLLPRKRRFGAVA
jgi:hypothetical protein